MHDTFDGRPIRTVIAFDPGGTTGYCVYDIEERYLEYGQLEDENHHFRLDQILNLFDPDLVVTERFDYRRRINQAELISVEYIGVLALWCQAMDRPLVRQQQLKGKQGLWTDDKLKDLSIYQPNKPHAMDAVRQMLYFITITLEDSWWFKQWKATQ